MPGISSSVSYSINGISYCGRTIIYQAVAGNGTYCAQCRNKGYLHVIG